MAILLALCSLLVLVIVFSGITENEPLKFDFGAGAVEHGFSQVLPSMQYTPQRGYGCLGNSGIISKQRNGSDALKDDLLTADSCFCGGYC